MKFIDLETQYRNIESSVMARITKVLNHTQYILGPEVKELEQKLADYAGVKHCIGVGNGTDALLIALMALQIKPGDEIITTPFTFIAPTEMALLLGAKIIFVDIDPLTYNLDPNLLEAAITKKTKAIIVVNLFGQCADFTEINAIAHKHKLAVIEDAAQSFGASYQGKKSCGLGTIGCTSFFPSKPLGCYGDGGACFTDDDQLAEAMRCIANHGQNGRYWHTKLGINSRLDTLQAAILLAKLEILPNEIIRRNEIAKLYKNSLQKYVQVPHIKPSNISVFAQYTISSEERNKIEQHLKNLGIPTAIHYPNSLHQQPLLAKNFIADDFPQTIKASQTVLSLPFHPYLTENETKHIAEAVAAAVTTKSHN